MCEGLEREKGFEPLSVVGSTLEPVSPTPAEWASFQPAHHLAGIHRCAMLTRHGVDLAPVGKREGLGHCWVTDSPARTNMALFLHRAVRLVILASRTLARSPRRGPPLRNPGRGFKSIQLMKRIGAGKGI